MPANVAAAAPTTVLPHALCSAYEQTMSYECVTSDYPSGESQREVKASSPRRAWSLARRLRPAAMQALVEFYLARHGAHDPFWFYDPYETPVFGGHDPTGAQPVGRYAVRFEGPLTRTLSGGRSEAAFALVEVA
jgi:hypothetical protein